MKMLCVCDIIFYILTFALFVTGLAFLAIGISLHTNDDVLIKAMQRTIPEAAPELEEIRSIATQSILEQSATVLIAAGAYLLILMAFAIYGSYSHRPTVINVVIIAGVVVIAMSIACYAMARVYRFDAESKTESYLLGSLRWYTGTVKLNSAPSNSCFVQPDFSSSHLRENLPWDYLMTKFQCCGARNYTDFLGKSEDWQRNYTCYGDTFSLTVPIPCCKFDMKSVSLDKFMQSWKTRDFFQLKKCVRDSDLDYINVKPCGAAMETWLADKSKQIEYLASACGIIQLIWLGFNIHQVQQCICCRGSKEPPPDETEEAADTGSIYSAISGALHL